MEIHTDNKVFKTKFSEVHIKPLTSQCVKNENYFIREMLTNKGKRMCGKIKWEGKIVGALLPS